MTPSQATTQLGARRFVKISLDTTRPNMEALQTKIMPPVPNHSTTDMAQTMYRGVERVRSRFILTIAANNLARLPWFLTA